MTNQKIKTFAVDTLYYLAGSVLYALGIYTFARPADFAPGGISGISLLVNHFTGLPIGAVTLVLNLPLALICFHFIGGGFVLKSLWATLISSLMIDLVFPHFPVYTGDPLLASVFTGVFLGVGLALIYMRGSSTGGSDFVVMSIRKKMPHLSVGQLTLLFDGVVIAAGGLVYGQIDAILYGIVASFVTSRMMDSVLYGAGSGKMAIIITQQGRAVADAIMKGVDRGATIIDVQGAYTGEGRQMILCACSKSEITKVRTISRKVDPGMMFMVTEASEVLGEGFVPPPIPGND